ncbi:MAG: hypothetical protein VB961_09820 [Dehalococcoidia bacterium]
MPRRDEAYGRLFNNSWRILDQILRDPSQNDPIAILNRGEVSGRQNLTAES